MGLAGFPRLLFLLPLLLIFLAAALPPSSAQKLKTFTRQYGNFNQTYYSIFSVKPPALISNGALQITPDSAQDEVNLKNQSGRVFLNRRFKLWDSTNSNRIASFNSSFAINIYRFENTTPAEGLAFVVAPDLDTPPNSFGPYLGLTNATTDGSLGNKIVAVEIDTFKDDFDIDANHIGLDLNSVKSINSTSLTPLGIEIAPAGEARFYCIWVDYDGVGKSIEIFIERQMEKEGETPLKPNNPIMKTDLDLRGLVDQYSYFGFSGSTGTFEQLNCVLKWNLTVEYFAEGKKPWVEVSIGVGVPVFVVLVVGGAVMGYYYRRKRRLAWSNSNILGALRSLPGTPREFEFRDLKKATNNFDEKNKLGQGGYGVVYRGFFPNEDLEVAVKWFSRGNLKDQDDFLAELTIINRLRHKHLVRLLGWCHKNGKLLLVYDYMPNGSLDAHLFGGADSKPLGWNLRYKILSGVASALHYLHNEFDQRVVHRDLKASNIMLDSDFSPRLGDFGLARALDNEKTSYAEADGVLGTMGYIAPECFHTGKATQQSDIYAFGAVLLEVVCGLRPGTKIGGFQFSVDWVWLLHRDGQLLDAVDKRLGGDYVVEEVRRVLLLGLACSHPIASERPKTQEIVQILSGSVPVPYVPPFRPAFMWPSVPMGEGDISLATTTDTQSYSYSTSQFGSGRTQN